MWMILMCIIQEKVQFILNKLKSFHPNIQFAFELEKNNTTEFLNILIAGIDNNQMETRVYRKETNTNIYIN